MFTSLRKYAAAPLSAVLLFLAYPGFSIAPLAWVALAPLFAIAAGRSPGVVAILFFGAGWLFHSLLLHWLVANAYWAGGWAIVGHQLLVIYLSVCWALTGAAWAFVGRRLALPGSAMLLAVLWAAMDKLQEVAFTGFGWTSLAYSQGPDLPVLQWASIGSTPLIAFFLVLANAHLALTYARPRERYGRIALAVATVLGVHAIGSTLIEPARYAERPLQVGLFQSAFPLEMKWDREYTAEMVRSAAERSHALAQQYPVDVMVWPEALVMDDVGRADIARPIEDLVRGNDMYLVTGAARSDPETGEPYNSAYMFEPSGRIAGFYDKIHLAPLGEYVPFGDYLPFVDSLVPAIGNLSAGTEPKLFEARGRTFAPLICFEILFPQMAAKLRGEGASFLVVVTNLAWFGASSGIPQELDVARMRAIETRLPLVHCANTGISGVFDPYGRFRAVDIWASPDGRLYQLRDDVTPRETIRLRALAAIPLPEPAGGPLVSRAAYVPWGFVAMSALLLLVAAVLRRATGRPIRS